MGVAMVRETERDGNTREESRTVENKVGITMKWEEGKKLSKASHREKTLWGIDTFFFVSPYRRRWCNSS